MHSFPLSLLCRACRRGRLRQRGASMAGVGCFVRTVYLECGSCGRRLKRLVPYCLVDPGTAVDPDEEVRVRAAVGDPPARAPGRLVDDESTHR